MTGKITNISVHGVWSIDGVHMSGGNNYSWISSPIEGPPDDPAMFDTRTMPYFGQIKQIPHWEAAIKILFYVIIIFVSLVGNLAVVFVVWWNKKMRTTTNFYIVNLAISDLMITLSCQWVHLVDDLTEGWVLGAFFCKFNSFAQGKPHVYPI